MKFIILIAVLGLSLSVLAFDQSKIIGDNDLVAVNADASNIPLKYKDLVNAFGIISSGCTATHIGNGYVLTAGHCFWAPEELTRDLDCTDTSIDWGVRDGISPYLKSQCEKILFAQKNSKNDFAILKVFPIPDASVAVEIKRKAVPQDVITIFSHPVQMTLHWSKTCMVEVARDPKLSPDALQHQCDTIPGSSGATIIDSTTNRIIGIHGGGRLTGPNAGMNYGTFLTNDEVVNALNELGFN